MLTIHSKKDTKSIIGPGGARNILAFLATLPKKVGTVAIGGINLTNVQRVIYQSQSAKKGLDGVAIVSAIIGSDEPEKAAGAFKKLVPTLPPFATKSFPPRTNEIVELQAEVPEVVAKVANGRPLCHNMINYVVANFAANVALAMYVQAIHLDTPSFANHLSSPSGASPIMSGHGPEAGDLASVGGSLLINMGTMTDQSLPNYLQAMKAYNSLGNPVVLDPVGAAATKVRRNAVKELMDGGYFDLIKGNEGELKQIYGKVAGKQHGVDSGPSTMNNREKATMVQDIALKERELSLSHPIAIFSLVLGMNYHVKKPYI
jgi:thiamine-phosphate diphosphorylase/hydroxyethylthiazole kinase